MVRRGSWGKSSEISFQARDTFRDRRPGRAPQSSLTEGRNPCARGDRCSASTVTLIDGETLTEPGRTDDVYCVKCGDRVWRVLAGMPEQWVRLHLELAVKGQATERVSGSRSAPIPPNAAVDALLREHIAILASWDERVRMAMGLSLPDTQLARRQRHGRQVADLTATLAAHLDILLGLPLDAMARIYPLHDLSRIPEGCYGRSNRTGGYAEVTVDLSGADAGEEILRLAHRTRSLLGETRMRERLDVPCPDPTCDRMMLDRVQGSEYEAECGNCGRLMSRAEYGQWVRLYANSLSSAEVDTRTTAA